MDNQIGEEEDTRGVTGKSWIYTLRHSFPTCDESQRQDPNEEGGLP